MVIAWRSVVDGCVLICLLCRVFFKVRANRCVGKSKDPKNRVPEIAVPDLVSVSFVVIVAKPHVVSVRMEDGISPLARGGCLPALRGREGAVQGMLTLNARACSDLLC